MIEILGEGVKLQADVVKGFGEAGLARARLSRTLGRRGARRLKATMLREVSKGRIGSEGGRTA